ncbi:MAG: translation initiation factor IF-2 [Verrucomicrobia bacterium]|nr:translation initiation factor IF-2 [Verrucomicrobiota bacterium]
MRKLQVKPPIVVRDFAVQMGKKPFQLISDLMEMSIFASMNYVIDEQVAIKLARNNGFELDIKHRGESQPQQPKKEKAKVDESQLLEPRPPVVCILGHVDHGKTTLLDAIRKTNVVAGEAGGITQHIGAYQVEHKGQKITFIDTPGHAAFSNMRARGANVTDVAVLVVAADDGFMPQTDEALSHAQTAGVPVVVAVNKMDSRGANLDRVKRQLQERNLTPEDWGGETLLAAVSALKGEGLDGLLDSILLQAELIENLKANPKGSVEGIVMEAQKELGRGSTASVIVRNGTLKPGDALVSGTNYCRVRMLIDDKGQQIKAAAPSTPVKIVGWSGTPDAGDGFYAVKNEREAKRIAEENESERRKLVAAERQESGSNSVEDLFAAIAKTQKLMFRVVVKADVFGTAEALAIALENIKSDKIELSVVDTGVGDITKNDVVMASASGASVVAFNVGLENGVSSYAKHQGITVLQHRIIYEIINQVKDAMADLLEPELRENKIGAAEVRAVFPLAKGFVAGCMVTEGRIQRDAIARLFRKGQVVYESRVGTLKRFKDDVGEVRAGFECGIQLDGFNGYQQGDIIECCEILKIKPAL